MNVKEAIEALYAKPRASSMKRTHQLKTGTHADVTAWQYTHTGWIPVWVANNFHSLGDGKLYHRSGVKVHYGEWICVGEGTGAFILTDEEFKECFRELPEPSVQGS